MHEAVSDKLIHFIFKSFKIILEDTISIYEKKKSVSIIGPYFHIFN